MDLLRAQVATAKARADQATAQGVDANATDALAREIDRSADDLRELTDDELRLPTGTGADPGVIGPDAAIARALSFRPEIKSADKTIAQARAARDAALRTAIPPVTLAAGYARGDDGGSIVGGPMVSASVQVPLSGIGAARVHAADASIRSALAHRASVQRGLTIEVGTAARSAASAIIAHEATAVALSLARSELDLAMTDFKGSTASGISVKIARDIYDQAVTDDIAARYAQAQAQATLDAELAP